MYLSLALLALSSTSVTAPQDGAEPEFESFEDFVASLNFETGSVSTARGQVAFDLPEGWALLQSRDARTVVEDLWGNPEDPTTLAFIDPPSPDGRLGADYGVIVTLDDSGYVSDEDAADIDYDDLLKEMKSDTDASNEYRIEQGYETVDLIGWAESPRYDAAEKKLYWAKELSFQGQDGNTLNYDVRILGRRGYLQLQAVAPMDAIDDVHAGMKALLPVANFTEGNTYSEFDDSIDKVAAYGIGGLIAGKVAAKVGLFAVIAKFGKLIIVGIIGLFVAAKKFLFGRGDSNDYAYDEDEEEAEPQA